MAVEALEDVSEESEGDGSAGEAPAAAPVRINTLTARALRMPGPRKAAVLLVALGAERAASVFRHLREEEIENVAMEMARLTNVDATASAAVYEELAVTIQAREQAASGGVEYAREVLAQAVGGDRAAAIIGRLQTVIERRPFEFLRRIPAEQIVGFLRNEAPQTIALVVASLHSTLAAEVIGYLSEAEQAEIALRIARMGETSPETVRQVENVMRQKVAMVVQQDFTTAGGVKSLAEILNQADRATERNVLESLTSIDEELGEEVRRLLFVFEDIAKLDDRAIQLILREADQKDLALALRGVGEEVRTRILANMSERGAKMLLEEMEFQPPQRKRVVEEAQSRIVAIVRRLEEADAVIIGRNDGDDIV
ncbi:MAG: flagellar motor switch protein FliG [Solirubrobacteraceae bacterium]|jgi:flagellar motor switch protein FliG